MQIQAETFHASLTVNLPYKLYLPKNYAETDEAFPIVMFLHGSGQRGNDLSNLAETGLPQNIEAGADYPFIVLAPQCPENQWWAQYSEALLQLVDATMQNYRVNEKRVYLTGLSMGGFGVWHLATEYPNRFHAIAPICGFAGDPLIAYLFGYPERLKRIAHIPVWAFHGDADPVVPIAAQKHLVKTLKGYGGTAKLTTYKGVGHDSWTQTYANPKLYKWLLAQGG